MTEDTQQRTIARYLAIHEAGHLVVAHALGLTPLGIIEDEDQILAVIAGLDVDTPATHFLHCVVAWGGMCAHRRSDTPPGHNCADDMKIAREHAREYIGVDAPDVALQQALSLALTLADEIVHARWPAVMAIADLIQEHGGGVTRVHLERVLAQCAWLSAELEPHECG